MSADQCKKINQWVASALKNEDFVDYQVEIEGQTSKGDGYSGEIHFVKVNGTTKSGTQKTLSLAIKLSMNVKAVTGEPSISIAYLKEVYIYDVVRKTFQKFLKEKNLDPKLDIMPHCYGTLIHDGTVGLVFENLRERNFQLADKSKPMTHKHIELILEAYGQWHALSLALRNQKPEVFTDLTKDSNNVFSEIAIRMKFNETIPNEFDNIKKLVFEENSDCLKFLQLTPEDATYAFTGMFFEDPEYSVILHGDCWNNNFLFQYSDDNSTPSLGYILDWQCSGIASPAVDLSHFIFSCADTEKYEPKELLEIYYNSMAKNLRSLGSNPEQVFPFEKLLDHWKRFSRYGMFLSCLVLRVCLMKQEEIPDFQETSAQGKDISETFKFTGPYDPEFVRRIKNNLLFYCKSFQ